MIVTKKIRIIQEIIKDMFCNKCGIRAKRNAEDFFHVEFSWGYFSDFDGETHEWDLCGKCYQELIDTFKIKSTIKS